MDKTDFSAFGQYIPGFDFLQSLARQASGMKPDLQPAAGVMPSLGHWVAPTFSVEEIEKRIHDLRPVEFWLEQNAKALAATIQALEVQKMTLATLENMNLSLKDVAESFKIKPETVQAQAPHAAKAAEPPVRQADESAQTGPKTGVDPMQWWNSLTEQFTTIASSAVQDMAGQAAKAAEQVAQTVQASAEAAEKMAEQARQEAVAAAARAAAQASEPAAASAAASQRPKAAAKKSAVSAAKKSAPPRARRKPAAE